MNEIDILGSITADQAEAEMLNQPQVECPVVHHFGPGIYMREVSIPAGTMAVGHAQRLEHLNILLKGRVAIVGDDGKVRELAAPLTFTGKPGRKVGFVLEDMVWLNVYATNERDIDKLEAAYLDKSPIWQKAADDRQKQDAAIREVDRIDYLKMLNECGITHQVARIQSENINDQVAMPRSGSRVRIQPSPIEGMGVFLSSPIAAGEVIAPARLAGLRTPAGRYTNHSMTPNSIMVLRSGGDIDLVATRKIEGCRGGWLGEEVTIDYRQALALSGVKFKEIQ